MEGKRILISASTIGGSQFVAAVKSDTLRVSSDLVERAPVDTGEWKSYINGRKSWEIATSYLVTHSTNLYDVLKVGTRVSVDISAIGDGGGQDDESLSGYAYVEQCEIIATKGSLVKGSFKFVGDGALS